MRYQAAVALLVGLALAGCGRTLTGALKDVQPPKVVTKVVEKRVDLPAWATDQLAVPTPANGKVQALAESHDARGAVIEYANCRSRLIERVQAGERVDRKECER